MTSQDYGLACREAGPKRVEEAWEITIGCEYVENDHIWEAVYGSHEGVGRCCGCVNAHPRGESNPQQGAKREVVGSDEEVRHVAALSERRLHRADKQRANRGSAPK